MSEVEKRQRDEYQKNRKRLMFIQFAALAVLIVITLLMFIPYFVMNKNTYIYYAEDGKTDVKVYLAENSYYDKEYLTTNHAYLAELIEHIDTDFKYGLVMDADEVDYKYSYKIAAQVNVTDRDSKAPIYDPEFVVTEVKDKKTSDNELYINQNVVIDYADYNKIAEAFVNEYELKDYTATLTVRMNVSVLGESETFGENKNNSYTMEYKIPLLKNVVKITTSSSVPSGEQKILACDSFFKGIFFVLFVIFAILSAIVGVFAVCFVYFTRDKHLDYSRKVQKLLSNYKSYIHRVGNMLNFKGYKVLNVLTFEELLEIGDKLGNPVLMYENEDKTKSEFFIATTTNIVYIYTIEVSNEEDADENNTKASKLFIKILTLVTSGVTMFAPNKTVSDD